MHINEIEISGFRNIKSTCFSPSSGINFIFGKNGSGKTSLLEAIYYLSFAKSFRTGYTARLINFSTHDLLLRANIVHADQTTSLAIQRFDTGKQRALLAGNPIKKLSELSKQMPIQFIDAGTHRNFSCMPACRRDFLNWGLFHVEHTYLSVWQDFKRALNQRNAALKHCTKPDNIVQWNRLFLSTSNQVNMHRQIFVEALKPIFYSLWDNMSDFCHDINLSYQQGWPVDCELDAALTLSNEKDLYAGYTHYGPHRSDLTFTSNNTSIFDTFSQGQLKLLMYLLHFSHSKIIQQKTQIKSIYLIDDLPAELDTAKRTNIIKRLVETGNQVFITGVLQRDLAELNKTKDSHEYHIDDGKLHLVRD